MPHAQVMEALGGSLCLVPRSVQLGGQSFLLGKMLAPRLLPLLRHLLVLSLQTLQVSSQHPSLFLQLPHPARQPCHSLLQLPYSHQLLRYLRLRLGCRRDPLRMRLVAHVVGERNLFVDGLDPPVKDRFLPVQVGYPPILFLHHLTDQIVVLRVQRFSCQCAEHLRDLKYKFPPVLLFPDAFDRLPCDRSKPEGEGIQTEIQLLDRLLSHPRFPELTMIETCRGQQAPPLLLPCRQDRLLHALQQVVCSRGGLDQIGVPQLQQLVQNCLPRAQPQRHGRSCMPLLLQHDGGAVVLVLVQ
mmetsp:Transcript_29339/g.94200  ORF Transcript_29339/g.94200 Transcript_29339/m.94200 type:complete len:299 (+) Transcript_29339:773-1669(+)